MGTHLLFCSSLLLILRDGRLGFCSDLHLTSSWVQVTPLNRNLQEVSKKSCSCYNSSAHISSGRAPPLIQQLHQSPDTYTAAQHQDRSIFLFAAHSKLSVMFVLSAWCFSRVPSQKGRSCLEALEAGSRGAPAGEQPQVVTGIQSAVSIRKWQAQRPQNFLPPWRNRYRLFLLTSCTVNVSGDRIHTFGIHTSCIATQDKVTSLQHLQLSNRILTLTGFLAEKHCVFQLAVTKKALFSALLFLWWSSVYPLIEEKKLPLFQPFCSTSVHLYIEHL